MPLQWQAAALALDPNVSLAGGVPSPIDMYSSLMRGENQRYVTELEKQVHKLESLFARLNPDVDLEHALASDAASPAALTSTAISPDDRHDAASLVRHSGHQHPALSEAVPTNVDGFDWREESSASIDEVADGMASLAIEPAGTGYLGKRLCPLRVISEN